MTEARAPAGAAPPRPVDVASHPAGVVLRTLAGDELRAALPALARLRITVFRAFPYLYEGDAAYEERYLATFAAAPGAVIVGAFARADAVPPGGATDVPGASADAPGAALNVPGAAMGVPGGGMRMVGAATACPLARAEPAFAAPFAAAGHDPSDWYYFGESVLEPAHRGRGIGVAFFAAREAAARERGFARTTFCAVERAPDDPRRPPGYVPLDAFWRCRGYAPLDLTTRYAWRDAGEAGESEKTMRFWGREPT